MSQRTKNAGSGLNRRRFFAQKALIEKFFPCFRCRYLAGATLECTAKITPSVRCATYTARIRYHYGGVPKVFILDPPVSPSPAIHMYSDHSLCLYFPDEDRWKFTDDFYKKIPWVALSGSSITNSILSKADGLGSRLPMAAQISDRRRG
jgi:hypothetical protein